MTRLHNKSQWYRRARRQLQREPLCAMLAEGLIVAARIADHIEPHHNDPVKFWTGALQSLCARTELPWGPYYRMGWAEWQR